MSKLSQTSSSSERKYEKYFYTVRGKDISNLANQIINNVKETALSKIKWKDVTKGACYGADCLVVFETGSSNSNRALDILSGIRERDPSVLSIISVILCTNNSTDHDKVCSSIDNHTFTTEKDISFECLIFSDGRTHECSRNIGKTIESQLKKIQEKKRKREENKSRVSPATYRKNPLKLFKVWTKKDTYNGKGPRDSTKGLEAVITKSEEQKLEETWHLTKPRDSLEKKKLEKGLKDPIRKWGGSNEAIKISDKSTFKENFHDIKKQGKYMYSLPKRTPEKIPTIITELRGYKQPPPVIRDVVLAAFILLGEKKDNLQDWETIRCQMGKLRQRAKDFTEKKQMEISEDAKAEISGILLDPVDKVRQVSSSAGDLYDWIRHYIPVEEHN